MQVQTLASSGMIGRPRFAQHLVESGQMPSMAAAFEKVWGAASFGDIKGKLAQFGRRGWVDCASGRRRGPSPSAEIR